MIDSNYYPVLTQSHFLGAKSVTGLVGRLSEGGGGGVRT
jgi:hypothetical protein